MNGDNFTVTVLDDHIYFMFRLKGRIYKESIFIFDDKFNVQKEADRILNQFLLKLGSMMLYCGDDLELSEKIYNYINKN